MCISWLGQHASWSQDSSCKKCWLPLHSWWPAYMAWIMWLQHGLCRLTVMMTELAKRPDVMKQLRQEQQEVMQIHGSDITGKLPHAQPAGLLPGARHAEACSPASVLTSLRLYTIDLS